MVGSSILSLAIKRENGASHESRFLVQGFYAYKENIVKFHPSSKLSPEQDLRSFKTSIS